MNKLFAVFLLLMTVTGLCNQVIAQAPRVDKMADQRLDRRLEKLYSSIDDLSEKQKKDIKNVMVKYAPERKAAREEMKIAQDAAKKEMKTKMNAVQTKVDTDLEGILTEEQMNQYVGVQEEREKAVMDKRKQMRGARNK